MCIFCRRIETTSNDWIGIRRVRREAEAHRAVGVDRPGGPGVATPTALWAGAPYRGAARVDAVARDRKALRRPCGHCLRCVRADGATRSHQRGDGVARRVRREAEAHRAVGVDRPGGPGIAAPTAL